MKAYVYKSSGMKCQGEIRESDSLEQLCNSLIDTSDFGKFYPELVISKADHDNPCNKRELQCDWVIEIYDDYIE